jgi:hypothetical protein
MGTVKKSQAAVSGKFAQERRPENCRLRILRGPSNHLSWCSVLIFDRKRRVRSIRSAGDVAGECLSVRTYESHVRGGQSKKKPSVRKSKLGCRDYLTSTPL